MTLNHHHEAASHAKELGFWVYLMSDAVIFALLFATYAAMRESYAGGPTSKEIFDFGNTFYESCLLLTSTLTCGFAMIEARQKNLVQVNLWLFVTALLGIGFLSLEIKEFVHLIDEGAGPSRSGFLSAFFTLVGTHGLHVTVGLIWLFVMVLQISAKGLTEEVFSRLLRFSLFWHFLDLIWVCLFSYVYLIGLV